MRDFNRFLGFRVQCLGISTGFYRLSHGFLEAAPATLTAGTASASALSHDSSSQSLHRIETLLAKAEDT